MEYSCQTDILLVCQEGQPGNQTESTVPPTYKVTEHLHLEQHREPWFLPHIVIEQSYKREVAKADKSRLLPLLSACPETLRGPGTSELYTSLNLATSTCKWTLPPYNVC
jgi:hypothetical protein